VNSQGPRGIGKRNLHWVDKKGTYTQAKVNASTARGDGSKGAKESHDNLTFGFGWLKKETGEESEPRRGLRDQVIRRFS